MTQAEKMKLTSQDITQEKREQLKQVLTQLFPDAVDESGINFDQLKRSLGTWVETGKERFGLQWPGKAECMKIVQQPSIATLKPSRNESVNFDETQNLFIEGDNLEVLKLLQKPYFGKIKMIYIDPPYNTGKDFIYPDNFADSLSNYLSISGQLDAEGKKVSTNVDVVGRFHSNWLNMMFPRLYLARGLLTDDGVIFLRIDDHEFHNLRALCDIVFGEENFVGSLIWKRRASSAMAENNLSTDHEYVICYKKGEFDGLRGHGKDYSNYSNSDNDSRGDWVLGDLTVGMNASMRPNQAYDLKNPVTGKSYPFNPNRVWAYIPESMNKLIREGRIYFPDDTTKRPMFKRFKSDLKSQQNPFSTLMLDKVGLNTEGTKAIQSLLGANLFDYSKPISLIETLAEQVTGEDDLILDFFAGSGTTAQAVMQLNAVDGGRRKFICVQLPEPTDKNSEPFKLGYKNIADISKERIRKAAAKIIDSSDGLKLHGKIDNGFKVFKLEPSNFKVWHGKAENTDQLGKQLSLHVEHIGKASTPEDILYELLLKTGFPLTTQIEKLKISDKEVFFIAEGVMLICLEKKLTQQLIDALADAAPLQVICLDEGFNGNDQLKANAVQTFKARAQANESEIVFKTV